MTVSHKAVRYHDISTGHRVVGHENKCRYLHGHNYRIHFHCKPKINTPDDQFLDEVGRVIDFGAMKDVLCEWLEENWDHKTLIYEEDPLLENLKEVTPESIVVVHFNPTAENMANYLLNHLNSELPDNIELVKVEIEETRKCMAVAEKT